MASSAESLLVASPLDILGGQNWMMTATSKHPPTVHQLFYLLGDLSIRWLTIGKKLKFSNNKLNEINADHQTSFRRMIEMFERWLLGENPSWSDIVRLLISIDEEELAFKVLAYTSEMERLESTSDKLKLVQRTIVPIKGFSFEEKIIGNVYYVNDKLARTSVVELQEFNEIIMCLMDVRHKWYEIGVALGLSKAILDDIDYPTSNIQSQRKSVDSKMRLMLQYAQENLSFKLTWKKLINALIDLEFNRCVGPLESIAPKHTTCTSLCRLDAYRRQDFVSTRNEYEDKRLRTKIEEIRNILNLDSSITDDAVLSNLFVHISRRKTGLSGEKKIVEVVVVIQELSVDRARESEQKVDDMFDNALYQAKQIPSVIEELKKCIALINRSQETMEQCVNYIEETQPHHENLLRIIKGGGIGAAVGAGVGAFLGAGVLSGPLSVVGAGIGGVFGGMVAANPESEEREKFIMETKKLKERFRVDVNEVNQALTKVQGKLELMSNL